MRNEQKVEIFNFENGKVEVLAMKFHFFKLWDFFQKFWSKTAIIMFRKIICSSFDNILMQGAAYLIL